MSSEGQQHMERELDERAMRALGSTNTDYINKLEKDRAWRWKRKLRLTFLAVIGLVTLLTSLYFNTRNEPAAAKKVVEAASLIDMGQYEQALAVSGEMLEFGNYEWYGHLYSAVALIEMQDYDAANSHADKLAAIFDDEEVLPRQFLPVYLLAKKLGGDFDQAILSQQVGEPPLYVTQTIQAVQSGGEVCFPLITTTERRSAYGTYKHKKCFTDR